MNAGLPSTGIGGIFYFFSVIGMVFVEIVLTIQGKSTSTRWLFVLKQLNLLAGMLIAIFATGYVLNAILPTYISEHISAISSNVTFGQNTQLVFMAPFLILFTLLAVTQSTGLILRLLEVRNKSSI